MGSYFYTHFSFIGFWYGWRSIIWYKILFLIYGTRGVTAITHTTLPKYIGLSSSSASSLVVFKPIEPKNNNFDTTNIKSMSPINHNISLRWAITQIEKKNKPAATTTNKKKRKQSQPTNLKEYIWGGWSMYTRIINNHELIKYQVQSKKKKREKRLNQKTINKGSTVL